MKTPWKLGICPTPDPVPDQLFLSVGRTLTSWERLDSALLMTFGLLIGSSHFAALRALGRIESPAARMSVLLEAYRSADPAVRSLIPEFEAVVKQVEQLTEARNAIAHGQVTGLRLKGGPVMYYLLPGVTTTRKVTRPDQLQIDKIVAVQSEAEAVSMMYSYALSASRIEEFGIEFDRLANIVKSWEAIEYTFSA